jgi:hypothetical protein
MMQELIFPSLGRLKSIISSNSVFVPMYELWVLKEPFACPWHATWDSSSLQVVV